MERRPTSILTTLAISVMALTLIAPWVLGQDPDQITEIRRLAEQGDAEAQYSLGYRYATGIGVPQDRAEAARWLRLAADQGHIQADDFLGRMRPSGSQRATDNDAETALALSAVPVANGQDPSVNPYEKALALREQEFDLDAYLLRFDRFRLWNDCKRIYFSVDVTADSEVLSAMLKGSYTAEVEDRLRRARLYSEEDSQKPYLKVNVYTDPINWTSPPESNVVAVVEVLFMKWLHDPISGETDYAVTWEWKRGAVNLNGEWSLTSSQVRGAADAYRVLGNGIDRFIDDYLSANEDAC